MVEHIDLLKDTAQSTPRVTKALCRKAMALAFPAMTPVVLNRCTEDLSNVFFLGEPRRVVK